MPTFLKLLESFNRKERFFLVGQALGNPNFQLSDGFRSMLGGQDAFGIVPPKDALVFMDYHLDWLMPVYSCHYQKMMRMVYTRTHGI